jgi:hypothetical protein
MASRFHAEKNHKLSWVGLLTHRRSPCYRASEFPPSPICIEWRVESLSPDYSGGTVPDLHRFPFYAFAGTQDLATPSKQPCTLIVNATKPECGCA